MRDDELLLKWPPEYVIADGKVIPWKDFDPKKHRGRVHEWTWSKEEE